MNKKRYLLILLLIIIAVIVGIKVNLSRKNNQDMGSLTSGGEGSYWFHLNETIEEKTSNALLVKLNDTNDDNSFFFADTEVGLDCSECKNDFAHVSEGDNITFYFFKSNIDGQTVKIEKIAY
ncbi:hypothetical protein [Agathobacter sp.]